MQISIRELKANPAPAIALARHGHRVQITSQRRVVAELVAPMPMEEKPDTESDEEMMQRLLHTGLIAQPANQLFQLGQTVQFVDEADAISMSDWVSTLRGSL
ncbi:MAG: hypothetical protein RIR79_2381 [Pseudomonadota bacterium]|jgi:antitoxin (DNA-binding transcriptional repressor) of toxin-antitoxin stability system